MKTTVIRIGILAVMAMSILVGCAAPTPAPAAPVAPAPTAQVVEKVVQQTVIVAGTPEVQVITATPPPQAPEKPFKVALIMPSSKDDMEWSQSMYEGLMKVQQEMGKDKLEVAVTENLYQIPDAAAAVRDYASQGYNLVIAHGSQYGATLAQIAPDFPNVSFAWGTSTDTYQEAGIKNIIAYQPQADQGGYVLGTLAAFMTKKNVIGITGPIDAGDARLYNQGFAMGIKAVKPAVKVNISYTGSFSDVSLMAASAETNIKAGADVLSGTSQSMVGAIGALKDKDVFWFGSAYDQTSLAPKNVVACLIYRWDIILKDMIAANKAGVPGGKAYFMTFKNGGLELKYNDAITVPAEAKAAAEAAIKDINDGKITLTIK